MRRSTYLYSVFFLLLTLSMGSFKAAEVVNPILENSTTQVINNKKNIESEAFLYFESADEKQTVISLSDAGEEVIVTCEEINQINREIEIKQANETLSQTGTEQLSNTDKIKKMEDVAQLLNHLSTPLDTSLSTAEKINTLLSRQETFHKIETGLKEKEAQIIKKIGTESKDTILEDNIVKIFKNYLPLKAQQDVTQNLQSIGKVIKEKQISTQNSIEECNLLMASEILGKLNKINSYVNFYAPVKKIVETSQQNKSNPFFLMFHLGQIAIKKDLMKTMKNDPKIMEVILGFSQEIATLHSSIMKKIAVSKKTIKKHQKELKAANIELTTNMNSLSFNTNQYVILSKQLEELNIEIKEQKKEISTFVSSFKQGINGNHLESIKTITNSLIMLKQSAKNYAENVKESTMLFTKIEKVKEEVINTEDINLLQEEISSIQESQHSFVIETPLKTTEVVKKSKNNFFINAWNASVLAIGNGLKRAGKKINTLVSGENKNFKN